MTEFVRVTDKKVNAARTLPRHVAEANPGRYEIHQGQSGLDRNGRPLRTLVKKPIQPTAAQPAQNPKV